MNSSNMPGTKIVIAIGSDHRGFNTKQTLQPILAGKGYILSDCGTHSSESCDYTDYAEKVCRMVLDGTAKYGILICCTGIGMSMAANKFQKIRAALVSKESDAVLTRKHNNANVLCLTESTPADEVMKIVDAFLNTAFEGGRHERRINKMEQITTTADALQIADPQIATLIEAEKQRQTDHLELIASENFVSPAVLQAQGSVLTNKYAEGYPAKRWYGGCEYIDEIEKLAIERAKLLFGAEHANVQPHCGSSTNMAVYFAFLKPSDRILTMDLTHGGHLTHGNKANFSGRFFEVKHYGVTKEEEVIDYDSLAKLAEEYRPKMITVGASAYPRIIDFKRMGEIARSVNAYLLADIAHIAGLVAAGYHPSPVGHADFVTTTTHKTLRGPRGGLILCAEKYAKEIDSQIFPGIQGGPLEHVIAAKAVCFQEALQPAFKEYQKQIVLNAKTMADEIKARGYRLVSGGTDNHLMLVDVGQKGLSGKECQIALDLAGITVNKNTIPFETRSPFQASGIRIGTPALTTRGMREPEMKLIAQLICDVLGNITNSEIINGVRNQVKELTQKFPLPY
jgi:RpiB/LacA/LacB family sugar-phosphate isomerase